jgi:hypothetical protein
MATYYLALAFDTNTATDPQSDGTHLDAQYGFGADTGSGVSAIGSGSGSSGRQFEAVHIPASGNGGQNSFAVAVFTNVIGINQQTSFLRLSLRPAHDVTPENANSTSPLATNATQTLLTGVYLQNATESVNVNGAGNYGLPTSFYSTMWVFSGYNLVSGGRPGTSLHFELTAELRTIDSNGTPCYFKVDPEMMIDF